jgi:hypothetical protein
MIQIFIAASGEVNQQYLILGAFLRFFQGKGQGMRTLQCRDNPFVLTEHLECINSLLIGDALIVNAVQVMKKGMFWTYAGIVESR